MSDAERAGSQPIYEMRVEQDVRIPMRDGVGLLADVYAPDAPGPFPALLSMHPYGKCIEETSWLGPQLQRMSAEYVAVEAGDHEFWARHGYVHVIADVRGAGSSEGVHEGFFSPQEQQDGYDLIEWIAAQDWCDGNVGMCGISYLGIIQYFVAAQRPPHLRAIFPHDAWGDLYRDIFYHGGIPTVFCLGFGSGILQRDAVPISPSLFGEQETKERARAILADESNSVAKNPLMLKVLRHPDRFPLAFDVLLNREDGVYYRERSAVTFMDRIEVPTYLGTELHGYPTAMHSPGVGWGWENISAPKKVAFRPCREGGLDRPFYEIHDEMLRWYDHWLKGIDTGIMSEPAVKVWVRGREAWRYGEEWPLHSITDWQRLHLRSGGRLTAEEPQEDEEPDALHYEPVPPAVLGPPLYDRPDFLTYATAPFDEDVEVVGPLVLHLQAALSATDGDFIVTVKDVNPDGSDFVLTRGWLRASHREVDAARSEPWRPFHPHTHPSPVTPGERNAFEIEIRPMANLFGRGHRLAIELWPCDYPHQPGYDWTLYWGKGNHVPYGGPVDYSIFHDTSTPSYLLLPVIGVADA